MRTTHYSCIKSTIGDWNYYVATMSFSDISQYVNFAEELNPNPELDSILQRELSIRADQITKYLANTSQRFLGSLIIAVYGGQPTFLPIEFPDSGFLKDLVGNIGILRFDGSERYYALDGQHRVAAIKEAIKEDAERYAADKVPVIVVRHVSDKEGIKRTRRLFTTLNRYAKKTSKNTNIAIDEDDGIAILTRRFVREHPFFSYRVKVLTIGRDGKKHLVQNDAISVSDGKHLMALGTFYKCNQHLLSPTLTSVFKHQQQIPNFEDLESGFRDLHTKWNSLITNIKSWNHLKTEGNKVTELRSRATSGVLTRPIGIAAFITALSGAPLDKKTLTKISTVTDKFKEISNIPWNGLLWNSGAKKMYSGKEREDFSSKIWRYYLFEEGDYKHLNSAWRLFADPDDTSPKLKLPKL